jgi:hypothetical protein
MLHRQGYFLCKCTTWGKDWIEINSFLEKVRKECNKQEMNYDLI